jgi:hypothetical protein
MQGRKASDYLYPFAVRVEVEMAGVRLTLKVAPHLLLYRKPHHKEIFVDAKDGRYVKLLYMEEPVKTLVPRISVSVSSIEILPLSNPNKEISVGYRRYAKFL